MIFLTLFVFMFCIMFSTRYRKFWWCWKRSLCADPFSRPQFWNIYWWIMWFLCGFEYIAKDHHRVYITTVTGIYVGNQGFVREKSGNFFLPTPWQPCWSIQWHNIYITAFIIYSSPLVNYQRGVDSCCWWYWHILKFAIMGRIDGQKSLAE